MNHKMWQRITPIAIAALLGLGGCQSPPGGSGTSRSGTEIKLLFGSALGEFCEQAIAQFNQQKPQLASGQAYYASCEAKGSGDVVTTLVDLQQRLQSGAIAADDPAFPTLLSVDGEIYQSQLIYRSNQIFPGQDYIPAIADSPLLVNSPMVFMTPADLADSLRQADDLYTALVTAQTHQDLDPNSPAQPIYFVHTAPTRSNSGLQTLVAQFASVSGKRPEELTVEDVQRYQEDVKQIQQKITRYGTSTSSLARSMVENGPFWASVGSVYESLVISTNANLQPGQTPYEAVYPRATFSSNMRAILPRGPWVSDAEREAAEAIIEHLRSPQIQQIATELGLRPGVPGAVLGNKFSPQYGVQEQVSYDSYRSPQPEVVAAMLKAWSETAKKPSLVAIVVDSSGSMQGNKLPAVQNTLKTYIENLSPQSQVALIDFDGVIREPVLIDGTPEGKSRGLQFIGSLQAEGGTALYDATLTARNWLQQNLRANAINAVLVLTDGDDSGSNTRLPQLVQALEQSSFESDARIAVFTIGYGNKGDFDPQVLEQMAVGGYASEGNPATIARLMDKLQLEF